MKKIFTLVLAISLLLMSFVGCNNSTAPSATDDAQTTTHGEATPGNTQSTTIGGTTAVQPNPESDFECEINDEGGITITKYIGQGGDVVIPNMIQGKEVTGIGIYAFCTNTATSVIMSNTITNIEGGAFYQCDKLEKITLSENLFKIGQSAFEGCTQLKHITIPSTMREFGDQAFYSSGLETIIFEEGIEMIGGYGSFTRTQLKQIVLPSTVKEIGRSTFAANPNLETVILNEGLVTIGHKAFVNNPSLKEIIIPKTVEFVTEMDFNMCSGLEKIMFDGDAPATFEYSDEIAGVWEPYDVHFTVYYREGAIGFDSHEWYGYPTEIW